MEGLILASIGGVSLIIGAMLEFPYGLPLILVGVVCISILALRYDRKI